MNYRGDVKSKDANASVVSLKSKNHATFVEWSPSGFRIGLNEEPFILMDNSDMKQCNRHACMIGNNTGISRFFSERIISKYDVMYHKRAYIHWYIREHMELAEFQEARENLGFMLQDYSDLLNEDTTDENDDESMISSE